MKPSLKRIWRWGTILLLGAGIFFGYLTFSGNGSNSSDSGFQTAPLNRGTLELTVSSTGTLAALETVEVGTEVSGTIEKVMVDYNSEVTKGQVLAILKQDLFTAAVDEAKADVIKAEADLLLAQREQERNLPLFEKGYLSEQEFLPYRIDAEKADASLTAAKAGLLKARTNLNNAVIRSPIDGTVIQRSVDAGQTVAASLSTPTLFIIARDLAQMQIEADVDETDIGQIREGQLVRFSVQTYPQRMFSGKVRQVRLQPEEVSNVVTYTVVVDAENPERVLLPGMTATLDFILEHNENVLLVPNAALRFEPPADPQGVQHSSSPRIFTLNAGRLQPIAVETGSTDGQYTVVSGPGLEEGMDVVTGVSQSQQSGSKKGFSLFSPPGGGPPR